MGKVTFNWENVLLEMGKRTIGNRKISNSNCEKIVKFRYSFNLVIFRIFSRFSLIWESY